MIDPTHPLTPWSRERALAVVKDQISRNLAHDAVTHPFHNEVKAERNHDIIEALKLGRSYRSIAAEFGICKTRVSEIAQQHGNTFRRGGEAAAD